MAFSPSLFARRVASFCLMTAIAPGSIAAEGVPQSSEPQAAVERVADAHPLRGQLAEIVQQISSVKEIPAAVLSPDGRQVAYAVEEERGGEALFVLSLAGSSAGGAKPERVSVVQSGSSEQTACRTGQPAWSADSRRLAFLSDCGLQGQTQVFMLDVPPPHKGPAAEADSSRTLAAPRQLTHLTGHLSTPRWAPDGEALAFLFVDHATRAPTPMAAGDAQTGVIDDLQHAEPQRLALLSARTGAVRMLSPVALTVFEYDWAPDSRMLTYTAAPPPGDDNWYIAELYTQGVEAPEGQVIFKPELQMAVPRWSPDGKQIAFIAGLMSDEGATGGEIYVLPSGGGQPRNLTPGRPSSPSWLRWLSKDRLLFTEFKGGSVALNTLDLRGGRTATLWEAGESIHAGQEECSLSIADLGATPESEGGALLRGAVVRQSWSNPPEVWAGPLGKWTQVTAVNTGTTAGARRVENVTWTSDQFQVQGWLLYPQPYDAGRKYPMLVSVHGGPAWIQTPNVGGIDFNANSFVNLGYFIFLPNPRGSLGQGELFTEANRRDWGFGDLRDTLAGVDAVTRKYEVDPARVGMLGWSYGGSTSMMAAGRTNRFRAVVAGAGASNLQSYYGQNQIDKWMLPYFGASVYDDPAAYMHSSALSYVKQVKTPTLLLVGERDEEAPPPQSFEFWHALKELGVPTQLVVYAGEGHSFHNYEDRVDIMERAANWFAQYMPPSSETSAGK